MTVRREAGTVWVASGVVLAIVVVGLSAFRAVGPASSPVPPAPKVAKVAPESPSAPIAAPAPKVAKVAPETGVGSAFVVHRVLTLEGPFQHGDYAWDEAGVPPGPLVVTVDLAAETLSVFRGGYEIGTAVILYGADDKPTPLGTYPITQKDARHVSSLYGAPMPYMLRLTDDGVSIHGSPVETEMGTHGCIGVPTPFARRLFAAARVGDRVIITRGKMLRMGEAIVRS